jgi:hypothetical protein
MHLTRDRPDRKNHVLEALGRTLFEELDKLGPTHPGDVLGWGEVSNWERGLYLNAVERLLEERELIETWLKLADDDLVAGDRQTGEQS